MANQVAVENSGEMDYGEHERTFKHFVTFVMWSIIHIAAVLVLLAVFLL